MINPIISENKLVKVNFSKDKEYYFCTLRQKSNIEKSSKMARAYDPP